MIKFFVGLILGIVVAGALAFYLNMKPNSFESKIAANNTNSEIKSEATPVVLAPGTKIQEISKDYDFYDILEDKKVAHEKVTEPQDSNQNNIDKKYYVQLGAFIEEDLARDMKAKLALEDIEATIVTKNQGDKSLNLVVMGPYLDMKTSQNIVQQLREKNINSTVIRSNI